MILDIARLLLFPALMAFAAAADDPPMIPNRVSLALVAGFFALALLGGMGLHDMLSHAAAGAVVLVTAFVCFAMGWVGGGDAKVAAGVALWFGFDHLLNYLVYASLFGGALTLLLLQFRQWPLPYPFFRPGLAEPAARQAERNPLRRPTLTSGALIVYPETEWIKAVSRPSPLHPPRAVLRRSAQLVTASALRCAPPLLFAAISGTTTQDACCNLPPRRNKRRGIMWKATPMGACAYRSGVKMQWRDGDIAVLPARRFERMQHQPERRECATDIQITREPLSALTASRSGQYLPGYAIAGQPSMR